MPHLIDLRFADDISLFARSALEVGKLWDSLVAELSEVDLLCNADNTVVLTSQSQPPSTITTEHGIRLKVRQATSHRNGCGCMSTAYGGSEPKKNGFAISSPASGEGASCQQIDFGGPEGSYFSASPLF